MAKTKLVTGKLSDFRPQEENANAHTERGLEALGEAYSEVGYVAPMTAAASGEVLDGSARLEKATEQFDDEALIIHHDGTKPIVMVRDDIDGSGNPKAKRISYGANRIGEIDLQWSPDQVLADIDAGVDLSGLFSTGELDVLLDGLRKVTPEDPGPQIDRAAELQEVWNTKVGQIWQIGEHRLAVGDCTDQAVVEKVMGGEKAILVITDPPYGVNYADKNKWLNTISFGNRIQVEMKNDHEDKEAIQTMWKAAFKEMEAVMAAGAVVYCFMPQGGDQMMMMMMMMGAGIEPRHEIIWLKNNHVLGRVDYAYKHEPILYAWKKGGHKFYGGFQTSILEYDRPLKSDLHPTMKPVPLIKKLIENSSQLDDFIFDPFLGSGTTLIAAHQLNRRCYGIEISPAYAAVCLQRISDFAGIEPVLG